VTSLRAISRRHGMSPKSFRRWRAQRTYVLGTVSTMYDATSRHAFLSKHTLHQGRKHKTEQAHLHKMLTRYRELRDRDRAVTLNLLAAELKRMDETAAGLPFDSNPMMNLSASQEVWRCETSRCVSRTEHTL
jgi:hypothetical protein